MKLDKTDKKLVADLMLLKNKRPTIDTKLVSVVILLSAQLIIGGICLIYRISDDQPLMKGHNGDFVRSLPVEIVVQIAGQINKPGVYTVVSGTRIQQLIELAGGALAGSDVNQLNLAAPLFDEQKVIVPKAGKISVDVGEGRGYGWMK